MVSFGASPHPLYSAGNATDTHPQAFIIIAMLPVTVHAALQISSNSSVCHRSVLYFSRDPQPPSSASACTSRTRTLQTSR